MVRWIHSFLVCFRSLEDFFLVSLGFSLKLQIGVVLELEAGQPHGEAGQIWSPDIRAPGTRHWCSVGKGLCLVCHAALRSRSTSPKFVIPPK